VFTRGWNLDPEVLRLDLAGVLVVEPREELAQDPERRRDDAARVARVDALLQDLDAEVAGEQPAQRRRRPELVVVAAARVEADDEARLADPRLQRVDVVRQVVA